MENKEQSWLSRQRENTIYFYMWFFFFLDVRKENSLKPLVSKTRKIKVNKKKLHFRRSLFIEHGYFLLMCRKHRIVDIICLNFPLFRLYYAFSKY